MGTNRRGRVRFKADMPVTVTCLDDPEDFVRGRMADLSVHGLSLILKSELPPGSLVRVQWGDTTFPGRLVYCQPRGEEFLVGLEVEDSVYDTAGAARRARN